MRLSEYASTQRTYGSRKVPRSVQQSIPIDQIYEDGTWRCGNVYSQMWSMPDINFTMSDEDNKAKILNLLGKVYMGVPSDCWLKICIVSQRMDEKSFRENVLLHRNLDGLDKWRVERNRRIRQCVQDAGNVVQHKYLILSTNKQNVTDARSRLRQVQGNLLAELSNLGCTIKPMTNNERLEVLHNFFRRGEEGRFQFSFDDYGKLGNDFRNTIAPDAMRCTTQYAKIDDGFAKAMTIAQYPQQLSDNFVATLLQQVPYIVLSIDITPVETEDAMREIEASQMKIDSEKYRANRRNVENLDFMATISPRNQQQEKYTAEIRNAICEGDQQVFMVLLSVAFFADTLEEIKQETDALQSAAANFNCRFTEMRFQQENCFNTAMPYGLRRVESSHMMLTRSVTALVPFVAQEVQSPQGIFYGRNAITGNLIVGDRTKLINGNAMVIATSGSGKSMSVKMEIIMEFLRWPNARFILVDPENEYELLVKALGGEAIKVSVDSRTYFNPLDYHYDPKTDVPPDVAKIEFVLSMLDKLIGENGHLQPEDRSLIAASLKNIYKPLIASGYTAPCPTLGDLYRDLNKSNLRRAKQLALMLDVFANGSLQAFSHTTNVDMNNRLICFNIQSLGDQLRPIAMMSLLEFINMQVMTNRRKDATAATWIYFDEIHVLLKDPMSSNFLYSSWKRFRKYNAYATGISQDIQDYLDNPVAYTYSTEGMYDVLCYLSDMEAEGLIYSDCYDLTNKTNFRSTLWGTDESEAPAYGFITFDWQASSTADSLNKDIVVVLPPVAKVNGVWQYYIDNGRAIKPDGWSISVAGCATDAELYRSCALLDYFFTEEGSTLQNYGLPMFLKENETYTGPDGKEYPQYTDWVMETCASVAKGDLSTFLRDWLGCLIPIGYQKDIGFEYQYTSERGFEGWELLQNSTTHFATYAGEGIKGDNPNYYKMVPPVFSLTLRQKEAISETTTMGMEDLSEEMFNIVRYNAKGNAPNGISIPADYNEYLAAFEARNLDAYVTAYQQAYQVMTAAQ